MVKIIKNIPKEQAVKPLLNEASFMSRLDRCSLIIWIIVSETFIDSLTMVKFRKKDYFTFLATSGEKIRYFVGQLVVITVHSYTMACEK